MLIEFGFSDVDWFFEVFIRIGRIENFVAVV